MVKILEIFTKLFKSRDKPKNVSVGSAYRFFFGGSTAGKNVTERSSMQMTAVYSCVRVLAEAVAGLPLHLYKYTDSGGKDKALEHTLYVLLHDEPNPEMTSFVFREPLMTHLLLWGNAYAQLIRNGRGEVVGIYPLMPNRVSVNRDDKGNIYYKYLRGLEDAHLNKENEVILLHSEVLHIPGLGFDGLVGYSPIAMAKNAIGMAIACEDTECFAFLAGHESFAAAEGAIGIAEKANKVRTKPLRVILNGLGKDAAQIIARINGFTYVETEMDYYTGEVKEVFRKAYSDGLRAKVNCYGANDVTEGVAIMWKENVDVSITGNSTNPTRFQHPVAGTYKKERLEAGKKYFSVASGGGTGRTLHPDNMAAGPASYGMTDTMGRMHSDAQFAGSSSVPAHVEMMGLIGMGNNPMVGATVAVAVSVQQAADEGKF